LIEILFRIIDKKGEKIYFCPVLLKDNHIIKNIRFPAVPTDPDESLQKEDVFATDQTRFANIFI